MITNNAVMNISEHATLSAWEKASLGKDLILQFPMNETLRSKVVCVRNICCLRKSY